MSSKTWKRIPGTKRQVERRSELLASIINKTVDRAENERERWGNEHSGWICAPECTTRHDAYCRDLHALTKAGFIRWEDEDKWILRKWSTPTYMNIDRLVRWTGVRPAVTK